LPATNSHVNRTVTGKESKATDKKNVLTTLPRLARAYLHSLRTIHIVEKRIIKSCPMLLNMTTNRKEKVIMAKRLGLTSWYIAMPYESMIV